MHTKVSVERLGQTQKSHWITVSSTMVFNYKQSKGSILHILTCSMHTHTQYTEGEWKRLQNNARSPDGFTGVRDLTSRLWPPEMQHPFSIEEKQLSWINVIKIKQQMNQSTLHLKGVWERILLAVQWISLQASLSWLFKKGRVTIRLA